MDSFQERKHKNFQVESDPFFGHLWNQTLIGRTNPGRHFGLGASRHMKKQLKKVKNLTIIRIKYIITTLVIQRPHYYGHFFWLPGKNRPTFLVKKPSLIWPVSINTAKYFVPLVIELTGFHCIRNNNRWTQNPSKPLKKPFWGQKDDNLLQVLKVIQHLFNTDLHTYVLTG